MALFRRPVIIAAVFLIAGIVAGAALGYYYVGSTYDAEIGKLKSRIPEGSMGYTSCTSNPRLS